MTPPPVYPPMSSELFAEIMARIQRLAETPFYQQRLDDMWIQQSRDVPALIGYIAELERRLGGVGGELTRVARGIIKDLP